MPEQLSLFGPARPAGVLVARGARAAEALLFGLVEPLLAEAARDPRLLARPVRIVVPSRSLRLHVTAALAARCGRAVAGVSVHTLHGLALAVVERAGEHLPLAGHLFDVLAERFARAEPALRRGLDGLVDGYAAAAGSVRDLLDAGLVPELAEAAQEALAADGPRVATRAEVERALALVRVAARTEAALAALGAGRSSTLLRRAAELLGRDPGLLPARAVLVHGFADATGVAADLIEALLRLPEARLVLDRPPSPGGDGRQAVERAFTDRLALRLAARSREEASGPAPELAAVHCLEATGTDAEVRAVALAARAAIDAGSRPEKIAIAARDLAPYGPALSRHLTRLGVPFSGLGAHGSPGPAERRTRAAAELLRRGEEAPCDLWLDAVLPQVGARGPFGAARFDVRLALNALGAGRLRDAAALDLERALVDGDYPLPIRQGLAVLPTDDQSEEGEAAGTRRTTRPRRRVEGAVLGRAVAAARRLVRRLESWPEEAPFGEHLRRLRALLEEDLGWRPAAGATPVTAEPALAGLAAVAALAREIPAEMTLSGAELRLVATRALAAAAEPRLGGEGGGVQVLSVMEARGRTFDHLFVVGLNRDQFPRAVREDPLLPDDLRRVLARVLPDVPVKARGFDEERYLFAQLLSAAPAVTLSWQSADEDGKARTPSPLLAALGPAEPAKAPPLWALPDRPSRPDRAAGLLRPADEHAILAALHGGRTRFSRSLPLAMAEARREMPDLVLPLDPAAIGRFRAAVLDEADPDLRTPEGREAAVRLGPWLGLTGRRGEGDLWVTLLEGLAGCPWRTFVSRVLRIQPTPDPLASLPGIDARLVGTLVHAVLEMIVREAAPDLPRTLPEVRARLAAGLPPALVAWPEPAALERLLAREAERVSREAGIVLPGMARALAERVRPFLEVARREDWARPLPVVGVEVEGTVEVAGPAGPTAVAFKADRVDLVAGEDGRPVLRLTDYKSGRPPGSGGPEARRRRFLAEVQAGARLQAAAYLTGAGAGAVGRYLFLRPDADDEAREITVTAGDDEAVRTFAGAAGVALGAWEAGAFIPRLVEPGGDHTPRLCASCEVAEACILGDSGARRRLLAWAEQGEEAGSDAAAALAVWRLGAPERREGAGEAGAEEAG